jgi:hypothetical protein
MRTSRLRADLGIIARLVAMAVGKIHSSIVVLERALRPA